MTNVSVYSNALKNLNVNLFLNAQTGAPYTETTGVQDNNDFLFDLRPVGVGRNTLRMPGQWDLSGSVSYTFGFHKRSTANVPGQVGITYNNGQFSTTTRAADPNRLHVSIGVYAVNITNHPNLVGSAASSGRRSSGRRRRPRTFGRLHSSPISGSRSRLASIR